MPGQLLRREEEDDIVSQQHQRRDQRNAPLETREQPPPPRERERSPASRRSGPSTARIPGASMQLAGGRSGCWLGAKVTKNGVLRKSNPPRKAGVGPRTRATPAMRIMPATAANCPETS